jgi:SAM-dependent methyltransferase
MGVTSGAVFVVEQGDSGEGEVAGMSGGTGGTPAVGSRWRPAPAGAEAHNLSVWRDGNFVRHYASRELRPAETMLMVNHRDDLGGDVLELGCGAGRLTGYLIEIGGRVHGIDLSPAMIAYCRAHYPGGTFAVGDLLDLSAFQPRSMDAVVATNNVLDVLGDADRRGILREIRRILRPGGLLWMSAHNREYIPRLRGPGDIRSRDPVRMAGKLLLMPLRIRNRRRLTHMERSEAGYALVNDDAHHFRLIHYYIAPDAQRRQLEDEGFEVAETRLSDGRPAPQGTPASDCVEVHYVARRPLTDPV